MALQVWLPLNKNGAYQNQGLANISVDNNAIYSDSGKLGGCYFYRDGLCQSFNNNLTSIIGEKRSICVWVKPAGNHIHYTGAIVSSGDWNSSNWAFGVNSNNTGVTGFGSGYSTYLSCNVPVNEWTHLACITNGTHHDIYKNGSYVGSLTSGNSLLYSDASNTTIGRETYAGGYFEFNGYINDLRIYDHCLSPKEVKEISKGLVLHYPLNDAYVEGTTNLCENQLWDSHEDNWGDHHTVCSTVDCTSEPVPVNQCTKVYKTYGGGEGGGFGRWNNRVNVNPNTTYCYSIYFKCSYGLNLSVNMLYHYEYDSNGNYLTEYGVYSSDRTEYVGNGWYRAWGTITSHSSAARFELYSFDYTGASEITYYLAAPQLEQKDHMTPYVLGTRNSITVYDCSGYQYNGTINGSLNCHNNSPRYNTSTVFNGNDSQIIAGNNSITTKTLTYSAWIYQHQRTPERACILISRSYLTIQDDGRLSGYAYGKSSEGYHTGGPVIPLNTWTHVALVWTESALHGYVNGEHVFEVACTGNTTIGSGLQIGREYYDRKFNGKLSDIRVYSTALSADDIKELYSVGAEIIK